MEREAIEKLAIDSAAGQLSEDAEVLLQEYLIEHPQASKWFQDMREVYNQTQAAFDTKTAFVKQSTENKPSLKLKWFPVFRFAAVIAIAVTIGAAAGRWSKPEVTQQRLQQVTAPSGFDVKRSSVILDDLLDKFDDDGFWYNKITAMLNSSHPKIYRNKNSGLSLLEQYRKYIKERNYD